MSSANSIVSFICQFPPDFLILHRDFMTIGGNCKGCGHCIEAHHPDPINAHFDSSQYIPPIINTICSHSANYISSLTTSPPVTTYSQNSGTPPFLQLPSGETANIYSIYS